MVRLPNSGDQLREKSSPRKPNTFHSEKFNAMSAEWKSNARLGESKLFSISSLIINDFISTIISSFYQRLSTHSSVYFEPFFRRSHFATTFFFSSSSSELLFITHISHFTPQHPSSFASPRCGWREVALEKISRQRGRGAVAQSIERPSKGPGSRCNSTDLSSNHERDMASLSLHAVA